MGCALTLPYEKRLRTIGLGPWASLAIFGPKVVIAPSRRIRTRLRITGRRHRSPDRFWKLGRPSVDRQTEASVRTRQGSSPKLIGHCIILVAVMAASCGAVCYYGPGRSKGALSEQRQCRRYNMAIFMPEYCFFALPYWRLVAGI